VGFSERGGRGLGPLGGGSSGVWGLSMPLCPFSLILAIPWRFWGAPVPPKRAQGSAGWA